MSRLANVVPIAFVLSLSAACAGDGEAVREIASCIPGASAFCACEDGETGTQICLEDGSFDTCVCGAASDVQPDTIDVGEETADGAEEVEVADTPDVTDTAEVTPDVADVNNDDADTFVPGSALFGEICVSDEHCESGVCRLFADEPTCTEECLIECFESGYVCFNRVCTPLDFCDLDASDDGVGPGCADAKCGGCPDNSTCEGFEFGRYDCVCAPGFTGDARGCTDVDECETAVAACPVSTRCVNTVGSYDCECDTGYFGPGCTECPGGAATPCGARGTCDDGNTGTGACDCEPRWAGTTCELDCYAASPAACSGANLTDANFSGVSLVDGDFSGATLDNLVVGAVDLTRGNFRGASGVSLNLAGATLESADFSNATLTTANFSSARGSAAVFAGIDANGATFEGAFLPGGNFSDGTLTTANFTNATMTAGQFERADFRSAVMTRVVLGGANLAQADLSDVQAQNANFSTAVMSRVNLTRADLSVSNFADANLSGGAILFAATLSDAIAVRANLSGADLSRAILHRANLTDAVLIGANFSNADLTGASFRDALLSGVTWFNTICPDGTNSDSNGGTCAGHLL